MDPGRLHETFHFISVTRSMTVGRTPWTSDQLVTRHLLTAPGDCDDGEVGGMNGFGRGNRSNQRKPALRPLCPPQMSLARPGHEPGLPRWGRQRLTSSAMTRPKYIIIIIIMALQPFVGPWPLFQILDPVRNW
jgi:hypothetical protein